MNREKTRKEPREPTNEKIKGKDSQVNTIEKFIKADEKIKGKNSQANIVKK